MICRQLPCRRCKQFFTLDATQSAHQLGYCTTRCHYNLASHKRACKDCQVVFEPTGMTQMRCTDCARLVVRAPRQVLVPRKPPGRVPRPQDLPDAAIEAILAARALERKRNPALQLRIEDPWAQRPQAALHQSHAWAGVE